MSVRASRRQVHRVAPRALLIFRVEPEIPVLPKRFRAADPLFKLARFAKFDRPLPALPN
jgi:hypothetical protein